jgi:hypothetical protein
VSVILARRTDGAFVPVDQAGADLLRLLRPGEGVEVVRAIDVRLHKKLMVLLRFAFDHWDGPTDEHQGEPVRPSFTRFRRDIAILAGHYDRTHHEDGSFTLIARSLSFDTIDDQDELQDIYENVLAVVHRRVLARYSRADLDRVLRELESF